MPSKFFDYTTFESSHRTVSLKPLVKTFRNSLKDSELPDKMFSLYHNCEIKALYFYIMEICRVIDIIIIDHF